MSKLCALCLIILLCQHFIIARTEQNHLLNWTYSRNITLLLLKRHNMTNSKSQQGIVSVLQESFVIITHL